jgi:hypothetical protein
MKRRNEITFSRTEDSMNARKSTHNTNGQTLKELLVLILVMLFAITGFLKGIKIGYEFGLIWSVVGGLVGLIAGIIASIILVLLMLLIQRPYEILQKWWRPYPPVCENGTCRGYDSYELCKTPEETRKSAKHISPISYRCKCGNLYAGGTQSLCNQWVRILSDGRIQPYLKHRWYGRWRTDVSEQEKTITQSSDIGDRSISKKDLEKYLRLSQKLIIGHAVFTLITIIIALAIWRIWDPTWWLYLLILWAGPFTLTGDFVNIQYCKRRLGRFKDVEKENDRA